jgi:hypothetical protein
MKQIRINDLYYEMLIDIAKSARKKPEEFIEQLIKSTYNKK